ncbi:hypothetical protein AB1Y20_007078 [Prymnesium parvum]|uniref:SMP-30/Gluconolactonase/LRE-like region domain-containing protein n=1 Tax=Prymnesium parvum TaxID=97485 RepID=A0AB34J0A2_PRYPA
MAVLLAGLAAQLGLDAATLVHQLDSQQRFFEQVEASRWTVGELSYVDAASSAVLRSPYTLAFAEDGSLFVACFTLNHVVRLRMLEARRAQYKVFVSGNLLDGPVGMAVHGGQLLVASFTNDHIVRVNASDGALLQTFGSDEELDCPEGLAVGPDGNLYVASFLLRHIVRYELATGRYLGQFAPPAAAPPLSLHPHAASADAKDLAFDWHGDLHVTAYFHNSVHKFNGSTGAFLFAYGKGVVRGPVGITCGPSDGLMYVASYKDNQVLRFSPDGRFNGVAAGSETGSARRAGSRKAISSPSAVRFDPHDGTLWVASYTASTVVRFNSSFGASSGARVWRVTD